MTSSNQLPAVQVPVDTPDTPVVIAMPVPPKRLKLTKEQERLWSDTRTALLWHCPAFSHILYSLLDRSDSEYIAVFTDAVPIAATDGSSLLLNPERFFKYNLMERVFIVAHEIMHCILGHMEQLHRFQKSGQVGLATGAKLPYSSELMNIATDLVINAVLVESKVGSFNSDWLHDRNIAGPNDSAIDTYAKIFKQAMSNKSGKGIPVSMPGMSSGQGQGGSGKQGFDQHLAPGTTQGKEPTQASQDRNETEWKTEIAAAANAARAQGKLPAGLERLLGELLDPKVDWREHIQAMFARAFGSETINWSRPERRYIINDIYVPETSGFGADLVVVAVDTSGSIGQTELDMFFAEVQGILEDVKPEKTLVVWCDAQVHRVDELSDVSDLTALRMKRAPGGGGTNFIPVFDEVERMGVKPDALVYLTDGYGSFPAHSPDYPVIWGDIANNPNYPFGEVVSIPR